MNAKPLCWNVCVQWMARKEQAFEQESVKWKRRTYETMNLPFFHSQRDAGRAQRSRREPVWIGKGA